MDEKIYAHWLNTVYGVTAEKKKQLSNLLGGAKRVFEASENTLFATNILKKNETDAIRHFAKEADLSGMEKLLNDKGVSFTCVLDDDYPRLLKATVDAPFGLYYYGTLPNDDMRLISVVGARRCSAYGQIMAEEIAEQLANRGIGVVSGMAGGVDSGAHRGALRVENGYTIAVLGCGVDICYPASNRSLYDKIKERGLIISEFAPTSPPEAFHFPMRNRIISGLGSAVIVTEAKERSGSLITADLALEQNREVYAVPGRITDPMSKGTNKLISQGAAIFIDTDSMLSEVFMYEDGRHPLNNGQMSDLSEYSLEKDELLVYSCLDFYPKSIDDIQRESGMMLVSLISVINSLCEKGLLRESFKNQYIRAR